jgi:hypothetical protein
LLEENDLLVKVQILVGEDGLRVANADLFGVEAHGFKVFRAIPSFPFTNL